MVEKSSSASTSTQDLVATHQLSALERNDAIPAHRPEQTHPRADSGRAAWSFLAACFVLEAIVWGFPFSFGIFQAYYDKTEPFAQGKAGIAAIGTTASGILYFGIGVGLAIMCTSLVAASFCNSVAGLIATQGVMYAIGGISTYFPCMIFIDEWFIARKGFAYGLMWTGTGSAGIVMPFLLEWLLDSYGFRTTLRVYAVVLLSLVTPTLWVVKPRLPFTAANAFRRQDLSFVTKIPFWVYQAGNVMQSLGYFLPSLWLPSFCQTLGLPAYTSTLSLAVYNLAYCFGSLLLGSLVDRSHTTTVILVSTIGSMASAFLFWGLATNQACLYLFAISWGLFAGGYPATWAGCAASIRSKEQHTGANISTGLVIALLAAGKGVVAVISGPLSERLLSSGSEWHTHFAYRSGYGMLIVFTGVSATLGGTAFIGRLLRLV